MKRFKRTSPGDRVFDIVNLILMTILLVITLYPFIYVIMYSFSDPTKAYGKILFWPQGFTLASYKQCFDSPNVISGFLVSVARATLGPFCTMIVIYYGAYALSKRKLIGRSVLSKLIVFTMYFSAGLIPTYLLIAKLKLINTFWVYILPALPSIFNMILVRTYLEGLPEELEESALLDGANDLVIATKIFLPLCKPIIAAVLLFECVNQWNAFQDTLLYNASNSNLHTLQYTLVNFIKNSPQSLESAEVVGTGVFSSTSLRMAMTVITILPIGCVYPFLQRYFVKGLMIGSIKG